MKDKEQAWEPSSGNKLQELVKTTEGQFPVLTNPVDLQRLAQFHKALGDETRLRVIGILMLRDACLCELVEALKVPASTMNHHLKTLERGDVIAARRDGKFTVYTLRRENLLATLTQWPLANKLREMRGDGHEN